MTTCQSLTTSSLDSKKVGCSAAIFALRQCVEYFVERGSSVFMAPLDAKKAFDIVNHVTLFCKLCDAGILLI